MREIGFPLPKSMSVIKFYSFLVFFLQNLSNDYFLQIVRIERNLFHHDFSMSKERLTNKLARLKYDVSNSQHRFTILR